MLLSLILLVDVHTQFGLRARSATTGIKGSSWHWTPLNPDSESVSRAPHSKLATPAHLALNKTNSDTVLVVWAKSARGVYIEGSTNIFRDKLYFTCNVPEDCPKGCNPCITSSQRCCPASSKVGAKPASKPAANEFILVGHAEHVQIFQGQVLPPKQVAQSCHLLWGENLTHSATD